VGRDLIPNALGQPGAGCADQYRERLRRRRDLILIDLDVTIVVAHSEMENAAHLEEDGRIPSLATVADHGAGGEEPASILN
jgi:hypothetical protein